MTLAELIEQNGRHSDVASISHWTFDSLAGRIRGCDAHGHLVMAIAADPLFGTRLAAAFNAPRPVAAQATRPEWRNDWENERARRLEGASAQAA